MSEQEVWLQNVLDAAVERYNERVAAPIVATPSLRVIPTQAFYAHVFPLKEGLGIDASSGLLTHIAEAWEKALVLSRGLPINRQIELLGTESHAVEMSLRWLMQHELNHFAIGHFRITGSAGLLEAGDPRGYGVASQGTAPQDLVEIDLAEGETEEWTSYCLELQADQDATEIFLGAYSSENWVLFRYYAICILVVMLIIEREERGKETSRTHPFAETRLFMLLAYLTELPFIPAYKQAEREGLDYVPEEYLPSDSEISGYRAAVVEPVFASSQILAEAVGLAGFWEGLGGAEIFFADVETVLSQGHQPPEEFRTKGAKQWAELKPTNDKILRALGF
ncbi:hypothetical protein [Phaeobacter inhibens]|uniref:hypothetical protein n=1 Tax=Phaeobacter inhibens TaxID=221822 RepID=UPI0021A8CE68|nr:hypothetical protein [Phaeobacter inhibens]UWR87836.1 hypothetical protein K4L01_13860 [Phaeobacter inhibens]